MANFPQESLAPDSTTERREDEIINDFCEGKNEANIYDRSKSARADLLTLLKKSGELKVDQEKRLNEIREGTRV